MALAAVAVISGQLRWHSLKGHGQWILSPAQKSLKALKQKPNVYHKSCI